VVQQEQQSNQKQHRKAKKSANRFSWNEPKQTEEEETHMILKDRSKRKKNELRTL
jgi:FtsZ-interacting cell division protein YlmF